MKELFWLGNTLKTVRSFTKDVKDEVGFALYMAQCGDKAHHAVPMVGFGSSKVLEFVVDDDGSTYRAVYTVKFADVVYVLHAFQKKSVRGDKTPRPDMDLIRERLKNAERHFLEYRSKQKMKDRIG